EAVREHEVAQTNALGRRCERGGGGPGLEGRDRGKARRIEVVHEPHGRDALAIAEPNTIAKLVPREADLRQVDADVHGPRRAVWGARQRPAHADAVLDRVAEPLVESDDVAVLALDLQVDLRAAELQQPPLGLAHEGAADPAALVLGCDRDTVEPAAM